MKTHSRFVELDDWIINLDQVQAVEIERSRRDDQPRYAVRVFFSGPESSTLFLDGHEARRLVAALGAVEAPWFQDCPACGGRGWRGDQVGAPNGRAFCLDCDGTGWVPVLTEDETEAPA